MNTAEEIMFLTFEALPLIIIAMVLVAIAAPFVVIGVGVHKLYKFFKRKPINVASTI